MKILFVRHAVAKDKKKYAKTGKPDSARPLTEEGLKEIKKISKILKKKLIRKVDVIYSSPYIRAMQTAEQIGKIFGVKVKKADFLKPEGKFSEMISHINSYNSDNVIVMVGHQPSMGYLISTFLTRKTMSFLRLDKAGLAFISVEKAGERIEGAELVWLMQPEQIIALSK